METSKPRTGHKSYESALNGVANYQQSHRSDLIVCKEGNQYFSKLNKLMIEFLTENELPCENYGANRAMNKNANTVQNNWSQFKKWLINK